MNETTYCHRPYRTISSMIQHHITIEQLYRSNTQSADRSTHM